MADAVWYRDGALVSAARALLSPASALYGVAIARITAAADRSPAAAGVLPALAIGNLTVGGTGKTPVSAWFARRMQTDGARPAIVMRGYGSDEVLVHQELNPTVPVIADPDRRAGIVEAKRQGADVAILDDAFQHRRVGRVADVVLLSADRWRLPARLLPAGPFREPLRALRRAQLVMLTVKAADEHVVASARQALQAETDSTVVTVDLQPSSFVRAGGGSEEGVAAFRGRRVLAVSGIGDPGAFARQLARLGVIPTGMPFGDHHAFDTASVARVLAAAAGYDAVVCTLKDAVKLRALWPDSAVPLWYVSQSVVLRDGTEAVDRVVRSVLAARQDDPPDPDFSR